MASEIFPSAAAPSEGPADGPDGAFVEGLARGDLSPLSIERYLGRVAAAGRRPIPAGADPWEILLQAGLVRDEKRITRAACLLFAKDPQRFIPAATVQCVAYGDDAIVVRERLSIGGTVLDHAALALAFIERNQRGNVVRKHGKSGAVWAFPREALAEALANAVCHRDYGVDRPVQISLFDEFLQLGNPGGQPAGPDVPARCRNPLLMRAFVDMGLARGVGTGLAKIVRSCAENGSPAPAVASMPDYRVRFSPRPDASLPATKVIARLGPASKSLVVGKMALRVYALVLENPGINAPRLGEALDVSAGSVGTACKALKDHGFIEHRGAKTGGGYHAL